MQKLQFASKDAVRSLWQYVEIKYVMHGQAKIARPAPWIVKTVRGIAVAMRWGVRTRYVGFNATKLAFANAFEYLGILHPLTHEMRILWLLFALATVSSQQMQGEIMVLEGPIKHKVWLKTTQGYVALNETSETIRFKTGIFIKGVYNGPLTRGAAIKLHNITVYLPSSAYSPQISSITYLLNICDKKNAYNNTFVRDMWFNRYLSLKNTFRNCSWGVSSFTDANNIIIGPLNIPCGAFDFSQCGGAALYGIVDYADKYTKDILKIDTGKYNRRILMLPTMDTCLWAGLGNVGCGTTCMAWINGSPNVALSTVFHELGHTLGLLHSSKDNNEYGDATCAMGISLSRDACYNAPHNLLLGWSSPLVVLDSVAVPYTISLPSVTQSKGNMIRIGNIFLSFTGSKTAFQSPSFFNKVLVHFSTNMGLPEPTSTYLLSILDPGMTITPSSVRITYLSFSGEVASVKIEPRVMFPPPLRPVCGDGRCNGGETKSTCPVDCCSAKPVCGDNRCDMWAGENCATCPRDCNKVGAICCGSKINGCNNGVCKLGLKTCNVVCP